MLKRNLLAAILLHVAIALPLLLLFSKVFTDGYVLEGMVDRKEITLPFHYLNMRAFKAGEYPQWCGYLFNGVPVAHTAMDYAWNPINWPLYFWGEERDIPYYITYLQILKHLLTGLIAHLFFRHVISSKSGAALATIVYTWSSAAVWMTITTELTTGLFLPLGMFLLFTSRSRYKVYLTAILGIVLAVEISGGVLQWTYFLWWIWLSYAIFLSFGARKVKIFRLPIPTPILVLLGGSGLAAFLSAPKILPFVGALVSGELTRGEAMSISQSVNAFQTPFIALIRVIAPNILGYLTRVPLLFAPQDHQNYVETMLAGVGFVAVTIMLYGVIFGRTYRRCAYPFMIMGLLLALILFKPVSFVWMALPGKGMIYSRWAVYLPLFLAWTTGLGLNTFSARRILTKTKRFWSVWLCLILLVLGIIYFKIESEINKPGYKRYYFETMPPYTKVASQLFRQTYYVNTFFEATKIFIGTVIIFGSLIFLRKRHVMPAHVFRIALLAVVLTELFLNARVEVRTYYDFLVPGEHYYSTNKSLQHVIEHYATDKDFVIPNFLYPIAYNPFVSASANSNIVFKLPQLSGFTNTMPRRYAEFVSALTGIQRFRNVGVPPEYYRIFGVGYEQNLNNMECFDFKKINGGHQRRARLVSKVDIVDTEDKILASMKGLSGPVEKIILLKHDIEQFMVQNAEFITHLSHHEMESGQSIGTVEWLAEHPNSFALKIKAKHCCFLFVSSGYYKGIEAFVDSEKIDVLRANYAFIAVPVPAGEHEIEFRYRNPYLLWTFVSAGLGCIVCIALFVFKQ